MTEEHCVDTGESVAHQYNVTELGHGHATVEAIAPHGLRFGIMCSGTIFQKWQADCIEQLVTLKDVELALLIVDGEPARSSSPRGLAKRLLNQHLLWNGYDRIFVRSHLRSAEPVDLRDRIASVPQIKCVVERRGKYSQYFVPSDIERVRAHRLDFIIRFAFNIIRGEILDVPRYGVWSYHHDDLDKYRGAPACFWEIFFSDPVTGVTLQRLTEGIDNGVVLQRGWFKTVLKSYVRNRDAAFAGSVGFPASVCRDIMVGEAGYVDAKPSKTTAPVFRAPGNAKMIQFGARLLRNKVAIGSAWVLKHDQWSIGIVDAPIWHFLDPEFVPTVRWLPPPPRGTIAADPFAIRREGKTTILYEELDERSRKGQIMAIEVTANGDSTAPRAVIDSPVHMSYPYLVEHEGEIFCIPEMAQSGQLALFRAVQFPWRWERISTLLHSVNVLDASIFAHEGRWWMLGTIKGPSESIELHGWHAPSLVGPWIQHACNPLTVDVRAGRPGGTPFTHHGALYRPSQDLSITYGGRIVIQHIEALTPTRFRETPAAIVSPRPEWPFPHGLHTLSAAGDQTIIDAKRHLFSPKEFWSRASKLTGSSRR